MLSLPRRLPTNNRSRSDGMSDAIDKPNQSSRRALLSGLGLTALGLIPRRLTAMQEPPPHGISALLEGTGMVRIAAGEFLMGSNDGNADEAPAHRVRISHDFEMSKFEITQAQWEAVLIDAHSKAGAVRVNPQGAMVSSAVSSCK